ncbi:hypothetical protein RDWZM_001650 [Blomia tropicalis]|uniref:Target of rapamycin complex subunit lst8 n=1 Tax=Blomia tropicalis TaxID=40697 RepID=A0A9Q0RQY0_BLOTA|nr:hypothetical protein RDWZM_001650 [Blomia tropicalis]
MNESVDSMAMVQTPQARVILCSGGYDHTIRYWNAEEGFCERIISQTDNSHINHLAISPKRDKLASAGFQNIRIYDTTSGANNPKYNFEGLSKNVTCVHFDPIETEMLYSGGEDGCVRIWDTRSDKQNKQRKKQFETPIQSIFLHPDRKEIYIADQSGSIYIWTILKDKLKRIFVTNDGFVNSIAYDHDCRLLAAIDTKGFVYIFRTMDKVDRPSLNDESGEMSCTRSFQRRAMFKAHTKQGLKCTFSPDSTLLATSSADQSIKFWKTSDFSIMNPAGVVQFDDPFESIQDKATGHASSASTIRRGSTTVTSTFKNTYSNNIENESELNQFGSSTNSFLPSPYSMGLYSYAFGGGESQQASRLPACFLKPKRNRCQMCHNLSSSNKASSDETSQTDRKNCSMGRSLYHIPGCKSSPQSSYGLGNMYSQLQTNLNSFSQLTWNVIESKMNDTIVGSSDSDVKSSPLTCNHYSHFSDSFQLLKHSTNHVHQTNASHIPAYYTRYFDNPYYDIYSGNQLVNRPLGKNQWPFTTVTPVRTLTANNQRWVWDITFTADSQYLFSASSDGIVRLWSVFTGDLIREYSGHMKSVTALAFSDYLV